MWQLQAVASMFKDRTKEQGWSWKGCRLAAGKRMLAIYCWTQKDYFKKNVHQRHQQTGRFPKLHCLGSPYDSYDALLDIFLTRHCSETLVLRWHIFAVVLAGGWNRWNPWSYRRLAAQWSPKADAEHGDDGVGSAWPLENQFRTFGCSGCGS